MPTKIRNNDLEEQRFRTMMQAIARLRLHQWR